MSWRIGQAAMIAAAGLVATASGQLFELQYDQADEDRWNYAFNATPGVRTISPTFGANLMDGFDDYDAQLVIGFVTEGDVPNGLGEGRYHVESLTMRAYVANDEQFAYDPTYDAFGTYLDANDPEFTPDEDPGRPVEMYLVGYRPPFDIEMWMETTAFGGPPVVPPAQGNRFIFAGTLNDSGEVIDISNRLKERFDARPLAVGRTDVAPGALVPVDSEFVFEADLCAPGLREHVAAGLDAGVLRFTLGSLQPATQGGDVNYPIWYTRENGLAQLDGLIAKLEVRVRVGSAADLTGSGDPNDPGYGVPNGAVDSDDFFFFLDLFASGDARADLTGSSNPNDPSYGQANCTIDADDFFFFLDAFVEG